MSRLYEGLWWAKLTLEDGTIKHSEVAPYEDIERFIQDASWFNFDGKRVVGAIPERYTD